MRLLAPLGALYGGVAALRAALYRQGILSQARLAGPVISVGNLSLGGSGKTPVVQRIARILLDAGLPVAILSRGYRGSFGGEALLVSDGRTVFAPAATAGDEPVMLARDLPGAVVAVGRRRDRVGLFVEARFGPRVHILDDGFQHLRLARDLDLLCVDASEGEDRPLPAGRLREFPSAARRADLVLLTQADRAPAERVADLERSFGSARTLRVGRCVLGFFTPDGKPRAAPSRPFLLAGIAKPDRFEADVNGSGVEVAGRAFFPDHHAFSLEELLRSASHARTLGADAIVTTAKDAVRLPEGALDPPVLVFRIAAEFGDEARLCERLLAVARRAA